MQLFPARTESLPDKTPEERLLWSAFLIAGYWPVAVVAEGAVLGFIIQRQLNGINN